MINTETDLMEKMNSMHVQMRNLSRIEELLYNGDGGWGGREQSR